MRRNTLKMTATWKMLRAVYRLLAILVHNLYCIPAYLFWMLVLRPILYVAPDAYWEIEGVLFNWLLQIVGYWLYSAGYSVCESGADIDDYLHDEALLLVNHQSTGDIPTIMHAFSHHNRVLNGLFWIMDYVFIFTNFGWVSAVHGDFFIRQGKSTRDSEAKRLCAHLRDVYVSRPRKWIVLFPEGGFLRNRLEGSQRYATRHGYPRLNHVTLPRLGAMKNIIDTLNPTHNDSSQQVHAPKPLKHVIDVTIGYPQRVPLDVFSITSASRPPCETHLHYRVYPITAVPRDDGAMLRWLYDRFIEKEQLLDKFYTTGRFPTDDNLLLEARQERPVNVRNAGIGRDTGTDVSTTARPETPENNDEPDFIAVTSADIETSGSTSQDEVSHSNTEPTDAVQFNAAPTDTALSNTEPTDTAQELRHKQTADDVTNATQKSPSVKAIKRLNADDVHIACLHMFFLVSFYVQYSLITDFLGYLM